MDEEENTKGYGQQDPSDSANDFNASEFHILRVLARTRTATLVQVVAVDTDKKTVDVLPLVKQLDGQNNVTPHGTVFGIPYVTLRGGKNAVLLDPEKDDIGLMVCSDRDISAVKATKAAAPPGTQRRFSFSDGVYLGGLLAKEDAEQYVKFTADGIEIVDKSANKIEMGEPGINLNGIVINRQGQVVGNLAVNGALRLGGVIQALDGSVYTGNITTGGDVVAGGKSLKTHAHTYDRPNIGAVTPTPTTGPN